MPRFSVAPAPDAAELSPGSAAGDQALHRRSSRQSTSPNPNFTKGLLELQETLQSLSQRVQGLESEALSTKDKLRKTKEQLRTATEDLQKKEEERRSLHGKCSSYEQDLQQKQALHEQSQREAQEARAEAEGLRSRLQDNEALRQLLEQAQREASEAREEASSAQGRLQDKEAMCQDLQLQLEQQRQHMESKKRLSFSVNGKLGASDGLLSAGIRNSFRTSRRLSSTSNTSGTPGISLAIPSGAIDGPDAAAGALGALAEGTAGCKEEDESQVSLPTPEESERQVIGKWNPSGTFEIVKAKDGALTCIGIDDDLDEIKARLTEFEGWFQGEFKQMNDVIIGRFRVAHARWGVVKFQFADADEEPVEWSEDQFAFKDKVFKTRRASTIPMLQTALTYVPEGAA